MLLPTLICQALPTPFELHWLNGSIRSLRFAGDSTPTDYIAKDATLGDVRIAWRIPNRAWKEGGPSNATLDQDGHGRRWQLGEDLDVHSWFELTGKQLHWHFQIHNHSHQAIEVGGLSTPLPMRTQFDTSATSSVLKHSFISGAGSFAFWMHPDSTGPYLTMIPLKGVEPEFWNHGPKGVFSVFLHSMSEVPNIQAHKGSWRLPHTSKWLQPGQAIEYGYDFEWAKNYDAVRDRLANRGKLDIQVVPSMTVPNNLFADIALRSNEPVQNISPEYSGATKIQAMGSRNGYQLYRIWLKHLGENKLTVTQKSGAKTYLEFFSTEPTETLIQKRAAFITRSQVQDSSKWYDGLLREWNMQSGGWLDPDHYYKIRGWRIYEVTCDDPGLAKPAFLASKNAEAPVQAEVSALDRYIEKFVWGGLQQTTSEPYPYAIYGIPDWKTLRNSKETDKTKGVNHLWRCYDYPHVIVMYHSMYRVASEHPEISTKLNASTYLKRAFGTAQAMYTIPDLLVHWSPYETGYYNEVVIPILIQDLRRNQMTKEANLLAGYWAKKVHQFVSSPVDLFGSEYAFDSTGFESTEVLASTAITDPAKYGSNPAQAQNFLQRQMDANIFCRGSIEPAYYLLGSDYRSGGGDGYTLSYMAPMGGSSVLDFGLHHAESPASYLRLGYQSILSSWALMNTGTPSSHFGYWFPGKDNDGGAGGGFEPASYGKTWLDQPHGRGSWYYSCETDLGFCGYLRAARTLISDDPIFGRFCFCGLAENKGQQYRVQPLDGVQRRLSIRTHRTKLDVELRGEHFSSGYCISLDERGRTIQLDLAPTNALDSEVSVDGATGVLLDGSPLPPDGNDRSVFRLGGSKHQRRLTLKLGQARG